MKSEGKVKQDHVTQTQQHLCGVKCFKSFGMLRSLGKNSQKQKLSITGAGDGLIGPRPRLKSTHAHTAGSDPQV